MPEPYQAALECGSQEHCEAYASEPTMAVKVTHDKEGCTTTPFMDQGGT